MPEAYTHIRIARDALQQSGQKVSSMNAYEMGANGPDPLFAYHVLSRNDPINLAMLGNRMHKEQCGAFLRALIFRAWTQTQRSYVLGFLTHYAADSLMHPYVEAASRKGGQFEGEHGHGFCEVALDSYFYYEDTNQKAVPAKEVAPPLYTAELAEVVELLHAAILEVYDEELSRESLADAFHDFRWLHGIFCSPKGGKKKLVWLVERLILQNPGYGMSHMTPAEIPAEGFTNQWRNPYTKIQQNTSPQQLAQDAAKTAAEYIKAACGYWQGLGTKERLASVIGDRSYLTGLLSKPSRQKV